MKPKLCLHNTMEIQNCGLWVLALTLVREIWILSFFHKKPYQIQSTLVSKDKKIRQAKPEDIYHRSQRAVVTEAFCDWTSEWVWVLHAAESMGDCYTPTHARILCKELATGFTKASARGLQSASWRPGRADGVSQLSPKTENAVPSTEVAQQQTLPNTYWFYGGFQQVALTRPVHMGRASPSSADSNISVIQKHGLRVSQRNLNQIPGYPVAQSTWHIQFPISPRMLRASALGGFHVNLGPTDLLCDLA